MNYKWIIGILGMTTQIFAAHIYQSNLSGQQIMPLGLAAYIIEDYDSGMQASPSICLSSKTNSTINSTSSIEPETYTFEETLHLINPAPSSSK